MWKVLASGGALTHAAAGAWSLISAAAQSEPVSWAYAGVHALGPGMLGLATTVLVILATRPPEVLTWE